MADATQPPAAPLSAAGARQGPQSAAEKRRQAERRRRHRIWLARAVLLVAIVAFWQAAAGRLISDFFIGKPTEIAETLYIWAASGKPFSMGVENVPGATVRTRMPKRENSRAAGRVMETTPPFDAA